MPRRSDALWSDLSPGGQKRRFRVERLEKWLSGWVASRDVIVLSSLGAPSPKTAFSPTRRGRSCFPSRRRGLFSTPFRLLAPNRRSRLRAVAVCASRRGAVATFGLPAPNRRSRLRAVAVCASRRGAVATLAPPGPKPALSPTSRCRLRFSSRPRARFGPPSAPKLRSRLGPVLTPLSRGSHQTSSARSHFSGPITGKTVLCFPSRPRGHSGLTRPGPDAVPRLPRTPAGAKIAVSPRPRAHSGISGQM